MDSNLALGTCLNTSNSMVERSSRNMRCHSNTWCLHTVLLRRLFSFLHSTVSAFCHTKKDMHNVSLVLFHITLVFQQFLVQHDCFQPLKKLLSLNLCHMDNSQPLAMVFGTQPSDSCDSQRCRCCSDFFLHTLPSIGWY